MHRLRERREMPPWLDRHFVRRVDLHRALHADDMEQKYDSHYLQAQWGLATTMGDGAWLRWLASVGHEYGIRLRHPFLDARIVDFMCRVPGEQKFSLGVKKLLLRRAMHGILPESIRQRHDKANFHALFDLGMGTREADRLEQRIPGSILEKVGLIKADRLLEAYQAYRQGDRRWRRELFLTFVLDDWLQHRFLAVKDDGIELVPPILAEGGGYGESSVREAPAQGVWRHRESDQEEAGRAARQAGTGAGRNPGEGQRHRPGVVA
jgi:asparagine synthetase B (glutamine-hydrolysing)